MSKTKDARPAVQLIDIVFPGDTNHHGTLFGGVALAHMDKVAFLAASRHGRAPFVTASSQKIDFAAPAQEGDLVEVTGHLVRVGTSSLDVEVELIAEAPVSGERRLCTRGRFTLVARKGPTTKLPLPAMFECAPIKQSSVLRLAEMVFPRANQPLRHALRGRRAEDDGQSGLYRRYPPYTRGLGDGIFRPHRFRRANQGRRYG